MGFEFGFVDVLMMFVVSVDESELLRTIGRWEYLDFTFCALDADRRTSRVGGIRVVGDVHGGGGDAMGGGCAGWGGTRKV